VCNSTSGVCACTEDFVGDACLYSFCDEHRAMRPGLRAMYFDDYDFSDMRGFQERPDINRGSTYKIYPGVSRDHNAIVFQGLLRPTVTGW
jgi:hypothetical protein